MMQNCNVSSEFTGRYDIVLAGTLDGRVWIFSPTGGSRVLQLRQSDCHAEHQDQRSGRKSCPARSPQESDHVLHPEVPTADPQREVRRRSGAVLNCALSTGNASMARCSATCLPWAAHTACC